MASIETNVIKAGTPKNPGKRDKKTYTVRYRDSLGKQREKTFKTMDEAKQFKTDQEVALRYGNDVNLVAPKQSFNDAVRRYIDNAAWKNDATKANYVSVFNAWVSKAYEGKSVKDAASDRTIAQQLINGAMSKRHKVLRSRARTLIVRTLDNLIADGVIESHRVTSVELTEGDYSGKPKEFLDFTTAEAEHLAAKCGLWVLLQYRLGLRISEALGLHREDFTPSINGGAILHLTRQAADDGKTRVALKAKGLTGFRDVPVPADVWEQIKNLPDGPLFPGQRRTYYSYNAAQARFTREAKKLGYVGAGTHHLRHAFATNMIRKGMNIVMLAKILGHASTEITYKTYIHVMPSDLESAAVLMAA